LDVIVRGADTNAAVNLLFGCVRELYWKQKDLSRSLAFAFAAVNVAWLRAMDVEKSDPDLAKELRHSAKGMCYDIASFTWDGWGESRITITPTDLALGLDAAKANLRLAEQLQRGDLPMSRAHWMLAGHHLSAGNSDLALK